MRSCRNEEIVMKEIRLKNAALLTDTGAKAAPGSVFDAKAAENALRFHRTLPAYSMTSLVPLDGAARALGVKKIFVKDESPRFGLNAFKGLGGSYAVFRILCDRLGLDPYTAVFSDFTTDRMKSELSGITFVTATDGNHGKGVAWAARLFGCSSRVYMPAGSVEVRRQAIEDAGAESVIITDLNYDKAVELADRMARENGWILVQDTAWEGYEDIPAWIVEGYLTMAAEIYEQLDGQVPTHVFLQAGVGAMAGGMLGYLSNVFADNEPVFTIVEPTPVNCLYISAEAGDGRSHSIEGDPVTIMAGLNCGTPCAVTWPDIRDKAEFYCACDDIVTENAMRALAHPEDGDDVIVSGESGAAGYGAFLEIMKNEDAKAALGINAESVILCISSEGDTDKENYLRIVNIQ